MRWLVFSKWIEAGTQRFFHRVGLFIADWPWTTLIISTVVAVVLGAGIVHFREVNNVRDHFSADNSPSRYEFAVTLEFFKELGSPFNAVVALEAADGGSLLRPKYIDKALEIEDFLQYKLKVTHEGRSYAYSDFCGAQCETSDAVNIFLTMFRDVQHRGRANIKLTFPTMDVFGHRLYLANNFFQVQLNNRSHLVEGANLITINFHAIYSNETMRIVMSKWEHALLDYAQSTTNDPLIRCFTTSEGLVSEEVRRTGVKAVPLMSVTFVVIMCFTVITSIKRDPVRSKPWESLIGVLCPIISLFASFGTLFWLGYEFLPIVTVVPFLILAIGVDDVYIFLHSWSLSDRSLPLRNRIAETLSEAGPSITITSLTNFLSFVIGIGTPTPAIRIFCVFISVAVLYDYIYQIFFYTAVMTIGGRREEQNFNAYLLCVKVPEDKRVSEDGKDLPKWRRNLDRIGSKFVDLWVEFSVSTTARVGLVVFLVIYWAISAYGVSKIKVGLTSEKLFLDDSPLLELVYLQNNVIFREGGQFGVFVNKPGDLTKPDAVPEMMRILDRFEHAPKSVGPSSTQMWLNPYLPFIGLQNRGSIDFKYKYLPEFFSLPEYHRWSHFVSMGPANDCYEEKPTCINKFFFLTGFSNAIAWSERLELLQVWRSMAIEYPHLNLSIYEDFSLYSDQLLTIPPVTQQTVFYALVCMTVVLVLFTPNLSTIIPGIGCVLSINLGVFGLLFYCDIDLDPISMATTLMAIGLSVDFVAHISFHYYKGEIEDRNERLRHALLSIAWPMMQAGTSTVISLLPLATIHAYMVQVFVKTVALVVALGLLHGLVVLPIVYAWIPFNKFDPSGKKYDDAVKRSSHPRLGPTKIAIRSSPEVVKRISADGKVTTTESDVMTVVTSPETAITKQPLGRKDSSRG